MAWGLRICATCVFVWVGVSESVEVGEEFSVSCSPSESLAFSLDVAEVTLFQSLYVKLIYSLKTVAKEAVCYFFLLFYFSGFFCFVLFWVFLVAVLLLFFMFCYKGNMTGTKLISKLTQLAYHLTASGQNTQGNHWKILQLLHVLL